MFKTYLASISARGLETLNLDDDTIADLLRSSLSKAVGVRAVASDDIIEMVEQDLRSGRNRLALATLDAGAIEVSGILHRCG
jgi:hypothetical protein